MSHAIWAPVLTSDAGLCLTPNNWHEVNVQTVVYYLDALLFKPGLDVLHSISNFAHYTNCSGEVIINASTLVANKEGTIILRSPYNGSKLSLNYPQLIKLINHLKPSRVILPRGIIKNYPQIWDEWNQEIVPYITNEDLVGDTPSMHYGVYLSISESSFDEHLQANAHLLRYVQGALSLASMKELSQKENLIMECEEPTEYGFLGLAYDGLNVINLKEDKHALSFEKINSSCQCPTCASNLTKAYLHHLYAHTPLLCQRFLIQHNAWSAQQQFVRP